MTPEPSMVTAAVSDAAGATDALANLSQGLIGALIGAGLALLAAFWLQHKELERRARGTARAVADECRTNAVKIRIALAGGTFDVLSRAVFDALAAEVGSALSGPDFMKVGVAYSSQTVFEKVHRAREAGTATTDDERSLRSLLRITRDARDVLNQRGWTKSEYAKLKDAAEEEKQKLALDV